MNFSMIFFRVSAPEEAAAAATLYPASRHTVSRFEAANGLLTAQKTLHKGRRATEGQSTPFL